MSNRSNDDGKSSVGRAYESATSFGVNHPLYTGLVEVAERKAAEYATARGGMRKSATPYYMTVALRTEEMTRIAAVYPELRLVNVGHMRPAHPMHVATRRAALAWCLTQAKMFSETVTVYGSPLVSILEAGFTSASLRVDPSSAVAVHERHDAAMDAFKIYSDFIRIGKEAGVALRRSAYDEFLRGDGVKVVADSNAITRADALCVDGMMRDYSPMQVASMMLQNNAEVAFGTFPYRPEMLVNREGKFSDDGVFYAREDQEMVFKYSSGAAGVSSYSLMSWTAWLTSHTFCLGVGASAVWYQMELLKNRENVMFYRMTRLDCEPSETQLVHALDLNFDAPKYVVRSYKLKGLGLDPSLPTSWEKNNYVVDKRLVDRTYQMAMTLSREQFNRFAIRKQLRIVNDRITIEGTRVIVNKSLDESVVDALVTDIFTRAFVDRFKAGTLTAEARDVATRLERLSGASTAKKLWALAVYSVTHFWESNLSPGVEGLRDICDSIDRALAIQPFQPGVPDFNLAPSYVLIGANSSQAALATDLQLVREITRKAGESSRGYGSALARAFANAAAAVTTRKDVFRVDLQNLYDTPRSVTEMAQRLVKTVKWSNPLDEAPLERYAHEAAVVRAHKREDVQYRFTASPDPVLVFNEFYSSLFPGLAEQNLEYDTASISLDPQDRVLMASYMKLPKYFGDVPRPRLLYKSKIKALNVPKRQLTLQEMLSAVSARNCNAPQVSLPQDDAITALAVWNNFLEVACVDEAKDMLLKYQTDPVAVEEDALREWITQSSPEKVAAVIKDLEETGRALEDMDVSDYLMMLKSDVKPTLSMKPVNQRTEPQVIVYHEKPLSAFYSSIFRVIARRFISLLKPNIYVNLLKDSVGIEKWMRGVHPFGKEGLQFLENDFSKFDKSQGKFVFELERVVFGALGMNQKFLSKWLNGHESCNLRAVSLGMSLRVLYQRKSGDATTALGNVIVNVMSVLYSYRLSSIHWGVFMGDDSLVCVANNGYDPDAVQVLAEVFNLGAKMYCTTAPYFASNFVFIDNVNNDVFFVPDPVKRIERWSMSINGDDPQWHERYISARDAMENYIDCARVSTLPKMIGERYNITPTAANGLPDAIATVITNESRFRAMWEEHPECSIY
ncbi:RNA-dependent RNA polymerase [Erysiphe necator associated virga-like virus 8]|uniref:RdRp n=1 Tax=Plasmopara viticola lesion associated vivivirus 3 TaxID=2770122 RepID=A0A7H0RR05_9VIRU|nr:RNA-dependent RNA polymerase [Erysiphe necator associated virga-like virus 8]QNQ74059.1 RdRp [Plasmopara viticola lesion associated vivivirus 3]